MISNYTVAKLQTANQTIDEVFRSNLDGITAELESSSSSSSNNDEWIGDLVCDSEDGAVSEHGENEISDKCSSSEYAGNGLMKNNSFRMKEHLTCVKDQGDRGTCVAFAVVAGMETRASIEGNGKRNFSEQFAWYDAKVHYDWWNRYEYGTDIKSLVKGLYKDDRKVSMESDWQYNRSEDMKDYNSSTKKHADSCDGYYGEYCTNFAFQAKEEKVGRDWVYTRPGRGHDGRKIKDYDSFFNFLRKEHSLDKAISYISNKKPVVLGFAATNRFNNAGTSSSFIDYYSSDSEIGGHAVLLVGYIKNSNLPSSAPKGEEGGYFIAKNSWGTTNGDCGYYYLSYKYVRKQAHRMVAILD
jgi:C1A family cysteine protease